MSVATKRHKTEKIDPSTLTVINRKFRGGKVREQFSNAAWGPWRTATVSERVQFDPKYKGRIAKNVHDGLREMTVTELRDHIRALNIKLPGFSKMKKADLIAAVEAMD